MTQALPVVRPGSADPLTVVYDPGKGGSPPAESRPFCVPRVPPRLHVER